MFYLARLVAGWPLVLLELWQEGYGIGGIVIRIKQEVAMVRGARYAEVIERYKL